MIEREIQVRLALTGDSVTDRHVWVKLISTPTLILNSLVCHTPLLININSNLLNIIPFNIIIEFHLITAKSDNLNGISFRIKRLSCVQALGDNLLCTLYSFQYLISWYFILTLTYV